MKAYRVAGEFLMGRRFQPFSKEVAAEDEEGAVERVLSVLGSKHRTKRKHVRVREVAEVPPGEVEDPVVTFQVEEG